MDILRKWYEDGAQRVRVYHNIDPNSLVVQGKDMYFAHPECWLSDNCANRYRIEVGPMDYITCDPVEVDRAMLEISHLGRGLYVSSSDGTPCEAAECTIQGRDGDAE